jgi:CRP-like cAMP-binding protein
MSKAFGQPGDRNLLLASLSPEHHDLMKPHLESVSFEQHSVLEYPDEEIERVVFPVSCVGSMVAINDLGKRIEVGLFGFDGMSGTSFLMDVETSPLEVFMQVAGQGYVIEAAVFRDLIARHDGMAAQFRRYVHSLSIQTSQTALSNGQAKLEERLAR